MTNWNGLVGPASMSDAIASKIQNDVLSILKDIRTQERVAALGAELAPLESVAFEKKLQAEILSWTEVVKSAKVKVD